MTSAEDPSRALVALGVVVRAHGLRGEVRVKAWNEDSDLLAQVAAVTLTKDEAPVRAATIEAARPAGETWIVAFEGVNDRDAAEALRGHEIAVPRSELPELEDEVYLVDLVGLEVYDGERCLGRVETYFEYPSVDCLRVVGTDGVRELPMLDAYVIGVDEENGRILAQRTDELPIEPLRTPR